MSGNVPPGEGKLIVLTAPLTETIDHAGYFIQMALASMPKIMEAAIDQKYPKWREVERDPGRVGPIHAGWRQAGGGIAPSGVPRGRSRLLLPPTTSPASSARGRES